MPPPVTARQDPPGIKLPDGFKATIAFARKPNINIWEIEVTPPGMDGGDKIDQTTMHNKKYRTSYPRSLITLTDAESTFAYDPGALPDIRDLINQPGGVTVHYRDGSSDSAWGYLQKFVPEALKEGEMPKAKGTVVFTNVNPTTGAEEDPVTVSVTGT